MQGFGSMVAIKPKTWLDRGKRGGKRGQPELHDFLWRDTWKSGLVAFPAPIFSS
jgi:hypothetical protein